MRQRLGGATIRHIMRDIAFLLLVALAMVSPAIAVADGPTDGERVEVYHQFRAAFDTHQFKDALPLAEKLVALTEEQYGGADRALVNPLCNLATTQYRLADYATAE